MASTCPACGSEMEFAERSVVLRSGSCPSCAHQFAYVEGATLSEHLPAPAEDGSAPPVGSPVVVAEDAPECEECGAPLTFHAGRGGAVVGVCSDCEAKTVYRPGRESRGPEERASRREPRPFEEGAGPRSRPCRRCGAPLRFSTDEEGQLVGECEACGNRFTLPPRPGGGGNYRSRPPGRGGRGGYPGRGGSRPSFYKDRRRGPPRSFPRREDRDSGSSDQDDRPRRRRPRDE